MEAILNADWKSSLNFYGSESWAIFLKGSVCRLIYRKAKPLSVPSWEDSWGIFKGAALRGAFWKGLYAAVVNRTVTWWSITEDLRTSVTGNRYSGLIVSCLLAFIITQRYIYGQNVRGLSMINISEKILKQFTFLQYFTQFVFSNLVQRILNLKADA